MFWDSLQSKTVEKEDRSKVPCDFMAIPGDPVFSCGSIDGKRLSSYEGSQVMGFKKVTIIGASGFVGSEVASHFRDQWVDLQTPPSTEFDANVRADLIRLIDDTRPDVIINCAGHTGKPNVDACENQKAECLRGNVVMPALIHEVAREKGVVFGHVSSGCIFTGRRGDGGGFRETDPPNFSFRQDNCSFYSGSKALGEEALGYRSMPGADGDPVWENPAPDCHLWRLRIPFSHLDSSRNFLSKLMTYPKLLDAENSLTRLSDFAAGCRAMIEMEAPFGLYHVGNPGAVTTREVTELIARVGREREQREGANPFPVDYDFFESEEEFDDVIKGAPRSNCVLDVSKMEKLGIHLPPVMTALEESLMNWKPQSPLALK